MQDIDQVADMAESAAGCREMAERWTGLPCAQPPTPSKFATSRALGRTLNDVT